MAFQRHTGSGMGSRPAGSHGDVRASGHQSQTRGRPIAGLFSEAGDDVPVPVVEEDKVTIQGEPNALQLAARAELAKRSKKK